MPSWDFILGNDILVSPIIAEGVRSQSVQFPDDSDWVDWWDSTKVYLSNSTEKSYEVPLSGFPVFKRAGSIIPLNVRNNCSNLTMNTVTMNAATEYMTFLISHPRGSASQIVREETSMSGRKIQYTYADTSLTLYSTKHSIPAIFLIEGV